MRALRLWPALLGTLALAILPVAARAQAVGSEFQVNTYTVSDQLTFLGRSVASDASGNFVVVWTSRGQDGSYEGVFGQRYDSAGGRLGSEFRVNSFTTSRQSYPSVAVAADGDFVVVWQSFTQDGAGWGIFGQRYDSAGVARGNEFRVNSYTTNFQELPSVASDASGNFVVAWMSYQEPFITNAWGVYGQRYDSTGHALGSEFRVNSYTTSHQTGPSVASDASGNFVVAWVSLNQDGDDARGIFGQRFDSAGVPRGGEFHVNSYTTDNQASASVASDADGNFVVVWDGESPGDQQIAILGQRYDSGGAAQGDEFRVNSYTERIQEKPSVAFDAGGNFIVVWESDQSQDGSFGGVFGQRFDGSGVAQGGEFQVNTYTTGDQSSPTVAAASAGQFVVAWTSYRQDGKRDGVFGQRYNSSGNTVTVVSPNTNVKWRIGSQKEIRWTHNVGIDATFRIELDRNGDGGYEELIAAAAPANSVTSGSFAWAISGPPSRKARMRVSWTDDLSVSDASDTTFQIRPASLDGEQ